MNSSELQQQINERCPCYAKPLRECNCQFDEGDTVTNEEKLNRIIALLSEIEKPPKSWDKSAKARILENIKEALKLAILMRV